MKNSDYKYRVRPRQAVTEEAEGEEGPAAAPRASAEEHKHLQRKVHELVQFFQSSSRPRKAKPSSNSVRRSPIKTQQAQAQAQATLAPQQTGGQAKRAVNSLKNAIGRSAKSPGVQRPGKIQASRSNE